MIKKTIITILSLAISLPVFAQTAPSPRQLRVDAVQDRLEQHQEQMEDRVEDRMEKQEDRMEEQEDRMEAKAEARAMHREEFEVRRADRMEAMEQKKEEVEDRVEARKLELRERLAQITDERRQDLVTNLHDKLNRANTNFMDRLDHILDKLDNLLARISDRLDEARDDGLDVSGVEADVATAQTALEAARNAVSNQAGAVYEITLSNEDNLRSDVGSVRGQLLRDVNAIRELVRDARDAVKVAVKSLKEFLRSQVAVDTSEDDSEDTDADNGDTEDTTDESSDTGESGSEQ